MTDRKETYFTPSEEERIIDAIRAAEVQTSGEIRVHISHQEDSDALDTTHQLFHQLRMYNTKHRNAVLIHVSIRSRSFAIYGDKGINDVVPDNFWESTKNKIQENFVSGDLIEGLCVGVHSVGEQLKAHFPWQSDDLNELPDEISYD